MNRGRLRKLTSDLVFDGSRLHAGAVLVLAEDGTIVDLLPGEAAYDRLAGAEHADVEYFGGLLAPGFINAHCHLELSHMRGLLPRGRGLVDFILQLQRQRHFPEEEIVSAMRKAENEMLSEGIVAVGDIANSEVSVPVKQGSRLLYHTFFELFGFDPSKAENVFSGGIALQGSASGVGALGTGASGVGASDVGASGLVPHAPYSVSEKLFRLIGEHHAASKHVAGGSRSPLISIHNQESAHEDSFFLDGTGDFTRLYREFGIDIGFHRPAGSRALQAWLPWLLPSRPGVSPKMLLVHNTYTTGDDVDAALRQGEIWWCLCPGANLYIEDRLPDVPMFLRKELDIVLGTDSLASNDRLSILEEMKTLSRRFPQIGLEQLLRWATYNGAEFFGWDHLGSFEKGKRPGVNLITGLAGGRLGEDAQVKPLVAAGAGPGSAG